jgi:hypothetical protein
MAKNAQSMSMSVIVVAALALLVLVVLSVIFMSRMGHWSKDSKSCTNMGGKCVDLGEKCPTGYHTTGVSLYKCYSGSEVDDTKVCCISGEAD